MPALLNDVARVGADSPVRKAYVDGLSALAAQMIPLMDGRSGSEKRREALAMLSLLVGAVTLARATRGEKLSGRDPEGRAQKPSGFRSKLNRRPRQLTRSSRTITSKKISSSSALAFSRIRRSCWLLPVMSTAPWASATMV